MKRWDPRHIKGLVSIGFDGKRERSHISFLRHLEGAVAWVTEWETQEEVQGGGWQIHFGDFDFEMFM